ncbi:hypothetical protein LX15_002486 [Streptoalloteichus tenebrarius]|uniref:Uncharacterized protein n=1 Tax=Streptoalloteichus tenebrarius (strain ATCC 17920 / DSM 40477 / JCM 4838 / CBS 697.72 / NBRC 16177 / NCIMB 11028 / NRRL B-12390 / A12253. 1 / ISP 5477) TaxID=1933 RepID=A0ABT1HTH6_STRSD|nr:hypothetical protein [Streptoalloteichus tenebrarius]BFE99534.1 hypothetical protein GCM10020241_12100 [Streptoalloteichus tenebrarius]
MVSLGGVAALAVGRYGADVVLRARGGAIKLTFAGENGPVRVTSIVSGCRDRPS